jgi:hypothetical protein
MLSSFPSYHKSYFNTSVEYQHSYLGIGSGTGRSKKTSAFDSSLYVLSKPFSTILERAQKTREITCTARCADTNWGISDRIGGATATTTTTTTTTTTITNDKWLWQWDRATYTVRQFEGWHCWYTTQADQEAEDGQLFFFCYSSESFLLESL